MSPSEPNRPHDVAVFIGRFQPWHNGHLMLLQQALASAELAVVVVGSAGQARTPKNPFSWQERAQMVLLSLPEADRSRVRFLPIRDYYDEARWVAAVRRGVAALLAKEPAGASVPAGAPPQSVALFGHFKDATSHYLRDFPGWHLVSVERNSPIDATALRNAYFGQLGCDMEACLAALVEQAPPTTRDFLRAWSALPAYPLLCAEWAMLQAYRKAWQAAPYPPVFVTVDTIVRCAGQVLLIRRGQAPGKGLYAVPGGFLEQRETVYQSALRELHEETGLHLLDSSMRDCLKDVCVFDHPDRSQRGRTITHAHYFDLGNRRPPEVLAADDAALAEWVAIDQLPRLEAEFFDDHFHMLDHFLGLTDD